MARGANTWLLALLSLGACNQVFDIGETDVAEQSDTDSDGLIDLEDNCPSVANDDQLDFDTDGVGDVCDNCPLYANTGQENVGEGTGRDEIGDDCDPNPTRVGDCLVLLDQFRDPGQLAANWELVYPSGEPAPTLTHAGDHVVFQPNAVNKSSFMLARVDGVRLTGRFSVGLVGDWDPPSDFAEAMAAANVESTDRHLVCGVQKISPTNAAAYLRFQDSSVSSTVQAGYVSGPPVRSDLSIRLVVEYDPLDTARCSLKWGVADGVTASTLQPLPEGGAGVMAKNEPFSIRAIALYQTLGTTCPTTILR